MRVGSEAHAVVRHRSHQLEEGRATFTLLTQTLLQVSSTRTMPHRARDASAMRSCDWMCVVRDCYFSWDLEALRNWRFEGSINGFEWSVLCVHTDDPSLDRKGG